MYVTFIIYLNNFSTKMSQSAYHFPLLPVQDILIGLADMFNISIDEGSFKRPDVSFTMYIKYTVKLLKIRTSEKITAIILKFEQYRYTTIDSDGMQTSEDPESTLFAQTCLLKT